MPAADGRRLQISWARVATPGMPFNQSMTFPCELTLRSTAEGIRLCSEPVREIATLHEQTRTWSNQTVAGDSPLLAGISGDLFDLRAEFAPGRATAFGITVRGVPVAYDVQRRQLTCGATSAALPPLAGTVRLRLLIDRNTLEIFGNDGRLAMPLGVRFGQADQQPLALFARGGPAELRSLAVSTLRSSWE